MASLEAGSGFGAVECLNLIQSRIPNWAISPGLVGAQFSMHSCAAYPFPGDACRQQTATTLTLE